jgi:lipopolysaccharide export system permease protein
VSLVLLLILVSNSFARYLGQAAAGTLPGGAVLNLVGLASLKYLLIVVPVGLFFGIMLALGRLYNDSEMTAMRACGIASWNVYRPIMLFAVMLTIGLTVLSLEVSPWVATRSADVRQQAKSEARFTHFEAGRFKSAGDNGIFYARAIGAGGTLKHIFAASRQPDGDRVVIADSGIEQPVERGTGTLMVLRHGYRYEGRPGEADFRIARFKRYGVRIHPGGKRHRTPDVDQKPTAELWAAPGAGARAELEWRIAIPVSALVLAFLAVPLARTQPRQGRYGRLFAAILVYIIYSNVLGVARVWVERQIGPGTSVGLWWVPAIGVAVAIVLLWRQRELKLYARAANP